MSSASPSTHIAGHFGDESFHSITCTGTDNLTRTTKTQNTEITQRKNGRSKLHKAHSEET